MNEKLQTDVALSFEGIVVRFSGDRYVHATDICKQSGKRISKWLELESTKLISDPNVFYFDVPDEERIVLPPPVIAIKGGTEQGTWIHPDLAVDLAGWINPKFKVWMLRVTRKLLTEGQVFLKEEIETLRVALNVAEEQIEVLNNETGLLQYQIDRLKYDRDELAELAQWRRANSWSGADS